MIDIATELYNLRKQLGLNQTDFAHKIGIKQPYVSKIESGREVPPLDSLIEIIEKAGYSITFNIEEKTMVTRKGQIKLIFDMEEREFILWYSSRKEESNIRYKKAGVSNIYFLKIDDRLHEFLEFLTIKYPSQAKNTKVSDIHEVKLTITAAKTAYYYNLVVKGDTTGVLTFKPSSMEDTFEDVVEQEEKKVAGMPQKLSQKLGEKEILMKTRGVFKYVTSCYYKDNTSTKNALVQVGYLDLDDNIVFNEPDEEFVGKPDTLVRYLPGFMVRGYRSCEDYVPIFNSHNGKDTKEISEVISQNTIQYSPSTYGNSPKVTYSVVGYLNSDDELIYYNQIANKE